MIFTIGLDQNWSPIIKDGKFFLKYDEDVIAQLIKQRIQLVKGENWTDISKGIDYYDGVFGEKAPIDEGLFINQIEDLGYGIEVTEFNQVLNPKTRVLTINFKCRSDFGEIKIEDMEI